MKKIILFVILIVALILFVSCVIEEPSDEIDMIEELQDKCWVGKDIVPESEISEYDCENISGCEWISLGGKKEMNYGCCPINLNTSDENILLYERCFVIID